MDEKGTIISTADVDGNLSLQIWTKGRMPRLVIFNKVSNSKKMIHLGWLEKKDRKLAVKGAKRGESTTYTIENFEPIVKRILAEYVVRTNFRLKMAKHLLDLEKVLHTPELVTEKSQLAMLSEEKRSSLWIADCMGPDKTVGFFRPFFPFNEAEAGILTEDRRRILGGNRGVEALLKTGIVNALKELNPQRWQNPVRVTAAAMLLGFSFCNEDGAKFSDSLWEEKKPEQAKSSGTMKAPSRLSAFSLHSPGLVGLGHKLTAFIRHFDAAGQVEIGTSMDSEKDLQGKGFSRSRRVDLQAGAIGDVPYRVTFYENEEEGLSAFSCVPQAMTLRHTGELIYTVPTKIWQAAKVHDTMGNAEDDFYTLTQLIWARQFKDWCASVAPYVGPFCGLVEPKGK